MSKSQIKSWWADLPTETLSETAWERQMRMVGVEAYEQSRLDKHGNLRPASESRTGQKVTREVMNHVIEQASKAIEEHQRGIVGKVRIDSELKGSLLIVPADTAALITVKALIDATYGSNYCRSGDDIAAANYQIACKTVGKAIEDELNFRTWVANSREAARAYAQSKGMSKVPKSQAERLVEEQGCNERTLRRWRHVFKDLETYKWKTEAIMFCGEAMVKAVVTALPDHFRIENVMQKGYPIKSLFMQPEFMQKFTDMEFKAAQLSVVKKPMITRPKPWSKND